MAVVVDCPPVGVSICIFDLVQLQRTGITTKTKPHAAYLDSNQLLPAFRCPVKDLSFKFFEVFHFERLLSLKID
ncbi:hypothetical protein BA903_28820 [Klebsiella pneumoniae]|nr:hypothetical protein BA903_28820 [Klebsiella pneumoniae]